MKTAMVVYALIYNEEKKRVLMVNNIDYQDSWSLSEGAIEDNETLEQAIIREVQEKTV